MNHSDQAEDTFSGELPDDFEIPGGDEKSSKSFSGEGTVTTIHSELQGASDVLIGEGSGMSLPGADVAATTFLIQGRKGKKKGSPEQYRRSVERNRRLLRPPEGESLPMSVIDEGIEDLEKKFRSIMRGGRGVA